MSPDNGATGGQYGDADLSGVVDFDDLNAWLDRPVPGWAGADWDGTGVVDFDDLNLWLDRPTVFPGEVGEHAGGGGLAAVPEPSTIALMGLAVPALALWKRKKTSNQR